MEIIEMHLGHALQDAWEELSQKNGCIPECFKITGENRDKVIGCFIGSTFVSEIAKKLKSKTGLALSIDHTHTKNSDLQKYSAIGPIPGIEKLDPDFRRSMEESYQRGYQLIEKFAAAESAHREAVRQLEIYRAAVEKIAEVQLGSAEETLAEIHTIAANAMLEAGYPELKECYPVEKGRQTLSGIKLPDDDGVMVGAGDTIIFSYGIPPVRVNASIIEKDGQLIALTPGHIPTSCPLAEVREAVGSWFADDVKGGDE